MKVTTNTKTGETTCELEQPDRNKLAFAKTVLVKVAVATNGPAQAAGRQDARDPGRVNAPLLRSQNDGCVLRTSKQT